jgi:chromosome segregation ATPase
MIRTYHLAQINLGDAFNQLVLQVGIIGAIVIAALWLAYRVWIRSENAKIDRDKARIEEIRENTKRDSLISDLAIKADKYSGEIAMLRESVAEERGARNLLSEQLTNERRERLSEREELKEAIRDITKRAEHHEKRIKELETEINGKLEQIQMLTVERDSLLSQLADKQSHIQQLDRKIENLLKSADELREKINEQAEQIVILGKQLLEMEAKTVATTTPNATDVTSPDSPTALPVKDSE